MKWWESDLSDVKVGDELWGIHFGKCYIKAINSSRKHPIVVSPYDRDEVDLYTLDGKSFKKSKYPSLWKKCPFELPPEPVERPDFEVDHKVIVGYGQPSLRRHFCRWPHDPNNSGIFVYKNGGTSFTTCKYTYFECWEDAEK